SLPAQLRSNSGAAVWNRHLPPGRNVELRQLVVGLATTGPLLWHPPRRERNAYSHAPCAALHLEPRAGDLVAGVLVLDVGRAWRDPGRSNAGHPEDRQRSSTPAKGFGARARRIMAVANYFRRTG